MFPSIQICILVSLKCQKWQAKKCIYYEKMSLLRGCPPSEPLPASGTMQPCKANWGNIARIAIKLPEGVSPFTGVDVEAIQTAIVTQSNWTAAQALTTVDSLYLTPEIKSFELVPGEGEETTYPDGDTEYVKVSASRATAILYGLDAANEKKLRRLSGGGVDVMFINKAGKTIGKTIAEVGGSPFFRATSILGGDRGVTPGTNSDTNNLFLTFEAGAIEDWELYATEAFAKTI